MGQNFGRTNGFVNPPSKHGGIGKASLTWTAPYEAHVRNKNTKSVCGKLNSTMLRRSSKANPLPTKNNNCPANTANAETLILVDLPSKKADRYLARAVLYPNSRIEYYVKHLRVAYSDKGRIIFEKVHHQKLENRLRKLNDSCGTVLFTLNPDLHCEFRSSLTVLNLVDFCTTKKYSRSLKINR